MIEVNRNGEVWVYAEQEDGVLREVVLELCGKARELANRLNVSAGAVLVGAKAGALPQQLIAQGIDRVYVVEDQRLEHYQTGPYAQCVCHAIEQYKPQIVMYGATPLGRDLAPRVASAMRAGMTADCTDLDIQDVTEPRSKETHANLLLQIRPAFGGNIIATIVNYDMWPQMATVREGVMPLRDPDPQRRGEVIPLSVALADELFAIKLIEKHVQPRTVNLKGARVIVAGGAGVGSKANFQLIHELASAIGGAVGASRAAVDGGYISKDYQVGQTGTTVRPALYIAAGISGAVQHRAGMEESAKIIAINTDPDAPIFSVAHYGIVGDLNKVIPTMVKALKERVKQED
jgi:electron transfer flavoprotein alpha subunit